MIADGLGDLPVFPCSIKKRPLIRAWTVNARRIEPPDHWPLVGVLAGEPSGLDILDVDPDGFAWLEANRERLPPTRVHRTRRDGYHFFFRHAKGLRNSADTRIADGVDVRSTGGQFIWWPRQGLSFE